METKAPTFGIACCKPKILMPLASIKWFTGFYSTAGLLVASLSMYIVSQITTIEKQFGLSSSQTGTLLACNEIGYCITILLAGHFARKVHVPRVLCVSAILYGVSGILCSVPHFIYSYDTPTPNGRSRTNFSDMFSMDSKLCSNISTQHSSELNAPTNEHALLDNGKPTMEESRTVAMAFIGIGMLLQGFAKAPRFPMLATYLDDNTNKQETGFYMGIIMTVAIFGPALAYGLGGVFSQMYVTLEDVDLHPRDPRWLGAWWLGFLMFGICAIICGLPLMFFPKTLKPKKVVNNIDNRKNKVTCGVVFKDFQDFLKSIVRVLRVPLYTITLLGVIVNGLGWTSTMSFGPKYMEKQFNIPAWNANIIIAVVGILSLCIGVFCGGLLTRRIKLNPPRTLMLIVGACVPTILLTLVIMFLACEPAVILNWPSDTNSTVVSFLPSCMSDCGCSIDQFLPICGSDGKNYFSPCHAGCSNGLVQSFSNCSCVEGGTAISGLCPSNCPVFWPWTVLNFVTSIIASSVMVPFFLYFLRIVPDDIKSMAVGIQALVTALFAMLPGPVIGGKLVDAACVLWAPSGVCSHYDIDQLRYNVYGMHIGCNSLATLIFILALWKAWDMRSWPAEEHNRESEYFDKTENRPESDLLMGDFSFKSQKVTVTN